ncbi:MAG TPA: hypothetical protein VGE08_06750 [Steroidobacter sp.]|uniref:hypothetical protein n=1 Tax=Steroidobacter sp. TaxID=1978227 RepID=UPI002EDAD5AC
MKSSVAAACRSALSVGLLAVLLTGCGGGGSGGASGSTGSSNSGGSSGNTGGSSGNTGGSGDTGTGGNNGGNSGGPASMLEPVLYLADQDTNDMDELYLSIPGSPGSVTKINAPLVAGGWVSDYDILASGNAVVYRADQNVLGRNELFMTSFSNPGSSTRLSQTLTPNRDVIDFETSPDGTKVAYRADVDADDVYELYLVNVANPGNAQKLNGALPPSGWVRGNYAFSPDSSKVLYRADEDTAGVLELYLVDVGSPGQAQKVNAPLTAGGNVSAEFRFSADGTKIGYVADQDTDETLELYVVATDALGSATKVSGPMGSTGDVCRFKFSPDSQRVAYCADQDTDGLIELYTVALNAPGQSVKLNSTLVAGGRVHTDYQFSSDSSFIVYRADQEQVDIAELYQVKLATPGVTTKLNQPLIAGGDVENFRLTGDDSRVAYLAEQDAADVWEIYEVALAQPDTATKVSAPMSSDGVYYFKYAEDFTRIVYTAAQQSATIELYDVALSHPGQATKISGPMTTGGEVWDFVLMP